MDSQYLNTTLDVGMTAIVLTACTFIFLFPHRDPLMRKHNRCYFEQEFVSLVSSEIRWLQVAEGRRKKQKGTEETPG